jgi:hypothetical protein
MTTIPTQPQPLPGPVKYGMNVKRFYLYLYLGFAVLSLIFAARGTFGIGYWNEWLIWYAICVIITTMVGVIMSFTYNVTIDLDQNQIKLGSQLFNLNEVNIATIKIAYGVNGANGTIFLEVQGKGKGRILLNQPMIKTNSTEKLFNLHYMIERLTSIPETHEGAPSLKRGSGSVVNIVSGRQQLHELVNLVLEKQAK